MSKSLIISRTDGIGDVILTLPVAGMLKRSFPDATIRFIGRSYTGPIIAACQHIDEFINWDEVSTYPSAKARELFKSFQADAILHVFPNKGVARIAFQSNIPIRIGTSHRFSHWLYCNRLLHFGRKNSPLHEAQLNIKLLQPLGIPLPPVLDDLIPLIGLTGAAVLDDDLSQLLDPDRFNLILHPKSKGSAREWGVDNFSELIRILPKERYKIFISGSSDDGKALQSQIDRWGADVTDITGAMSLSQFIAFINNADGLVAASTGPLHIAAALGKVAVGLYAPMRPIHPGRWAPLGPRAGSLVLDKQCQLCRHDNRCACIEAITPTAVLNKLELLRSVNN